MSKVKFKIQDGIVYPLEISAEEWAKLHDLDLIKIHCEICDENRISNQPFYFKDKMGNFYIGLQYDKEKGSCKCGGDCILIISSQSKKMIS